MENLTTRQWSNDTQTVDDENDIYALIRAIATSSTDEANMKRLDSITKYLKNIQRDEESMKQFLKGNPKGDYQTPLHMASSMFYLQKTTEKKVVELLVTTFPDMILSNRGDSDMYRGQTPLHMAICRGNMWLVDTMLDALSDSNLRVKKIACLEQRATGHKFKNTVMFAELPLSIAALTCKKEVFDKLLQHGAKVDGVNSQSDSIYHCFIVYAYLYPEKLSNILDMMKYIHEESKVDEKSKKKLMFMDRMGRESTLQMAARYGQHKIFAYILEHAYCYLSNKDGLFDVKMYDITEIDLNLARALRRENSASDVQAKYNSSQTADLDTGGNISKTSSILDTMFDLNYTTAFEFIHQAPIRRLILQKWKYYKLMFYPFWLFHAVFMILLTVSAVERARIVREKEAMNVTVDQPNTTANKIISGLNEKLDGQFVTVFAVISVIVAFIYIAQEVMRTVNRRMPFNISQLLNPYSNAGFRSSLVLFALCLVGDFGATWSPSYDDYLLIVAIIVGWLWFLFFLRAIRRLSFFTSLIQRVLISDIARFAVIIIIELIAFNTALFILLQGSTAEDKDDYNSWWKTMVRTTMAFFGIKELPVFEAKQPVLVSFVYLMTLVLTTILMLNALIAVMSNTCTELLSNFEDVNEMHLRLQQLSVILFFESMLPTKIAEKLASKVAKQDKLFCFDLQTDSDCNMTRYLIQIDSIRDAENVSYQESREQGFGLFPNFDRYFGTRFESAPKFASMLGNRDGLSIFSKNVAKSLGNAKGQMAEFKSSSGTLECKTSSLSSFSSVEASSTTVIQSTKVEHQNVQMQKVAYGTSSGSISIE